jgi:response regulator RpfG family c-di-GMP phosphodiesterase
MTADKKVILIIDDSELFLETYKMVLEEAGFQVETVLQRDFSMQPLAKANADLVLLDVMMPGLYGDALFKLINSMTTKRVPTPVYLFSGLDDVELWQRAKSAGAAGYISKNWSMDKVVEKVQDILNCPRKHG